MTTIEIALIGAPLEAFGHPDACTEPKEGVLEGTSTVFIDGIPIGTETDSTLEFDSHGHDVDPFGACIDKQSHSVQQSNVSTTVSVNENAVYGAVLEAATDPGSGGSINYVSSGGNSTVTITE
jgi:hypothetical protein